MRKSEFPASYRRKFRRKLCPCAVKQHDGTCLGYGSGDNDDEPCDYCKECPMQATNQEERRNDAD